MKYEYNTPQSIRTTAFFTGHRQLAGNEKDLISARIYNCISSAYAEGYRRFFCGGALGFDTLAALQTIRFRRKHQDVILAMAIPCATQADRWSEKDQMLYRSILEQADESSILSPVYYQGAMLTRNRFMADHSSLCICYMRYTRGGTASTVRYALQQNRIRVINLAVGQSDHTDILREEKWNCMFTSPSADKNADIVPLRLLSDRRLRMKHM